MSASVYGLEEEQARQREVREAEGRLADARRRAAGHLTIASKERIISSYDR
jgi:hypothetical protein